MPRTATPCIACTSSPRAADKRVRLGGRSLPLCAEHAARAASARVRTLDELAKLLASPGERRSALPRRAPAAEDRRVLPPRPEGRRRSEGRRATDEHG